MEATEKIKVYVNVIRGKTVCVCIHGDKKCDNECELDTLVRDRYAGWKDTFTRDRYGKSKG